MKNFKYEIIADKIGNVGGHSQMDPSALTVHHAGTERKTTDDPIEVAKVYCRGHGGHMPYHIFIPRNYSDIVYITQWFGHSTWHNGNGAANKDCLALVMDGNFHFLQKPLGIQLQKLREVLKDFDEGWFEKNGWTNKIYDIKPASNEMHSYWFGKTVPELHFHDEVSRDTTACCGEALIPFVKDYRDKKGNVNWGGVGPDPDQPTTPDPEDPCKAIKKKLEVCEVGRGVEEELNKIYEQRVKVLEKELVYESGVNTNLVVQLNNCNKGFFSKIIDLIKDIFKKKNDEEK